MVETRAYLKRELGVPDAVLMGLGSIIGTGVFVSIGIAAGVAGPAVIAAIAIAAAVATCNALSSAQLAASHPVSGGTYEYGYTYLQPWLGFTAGWLFICAKSASAATAALGFAGYALQAFVLDTGGLLVPTAAAAVIVLTLVVLTGMRQSNRANIVIVSMTLVSLSLFAILGLPRALAAGTQHLWPFLVASAGPAHGGISALLQASALMFVAYTGYGRIATLGEEVHEPRRTIPRAIVVTLIVSAALYMAVALVAIAAVGADRLARATQAEAAPLALVAGRLDWPGLRWIIALGAVTAMLGVLLNLILGLSRVWLAMGRRRDMPVAFARLDSAGRTPYIAVIVTGASIVGLVLIGSIEFTWSFSAFTVLMYYAITNLAALRLPRHDRLYSVVYPWLGLAACLFLAFWVEPAIWLVGLGLIGLGLVWHGIMTRLAGQT